jgi:hypothetical protein
MNRLQYWTSESLALPRTIAVTMCPAAGARFNTSRSVLQLAPSGAVLTYFFGEVHSNH